MLLEESGLQEFFESFTSKYDAIWLVVTELSVISNKYGGLFGIAFGEKSEEHLDEFHWCLR